MSERWEEVGRRVLSFYLHEQLDEVESATYELMSAISNGDEVSPESVRTFRDAHFDLLTVVEEDVVPVVDGVESYEDTLEYIPAGVIHDSGGDREWRSDDA